MKTRMGPAKANTATAHKLSCIFYRMLRYGKEYIDPGVQYYEQKYRNRLLKNLKRRAPLLGYELIESQGTNCGSFLEETVVSTRS